jgi:23S rRNA (guanosine2251-2'-O)-methyltransferase
VIVYGRNPVREALRGRRAVGAVWASAGAGREPWLDGVEVRPADDARLESLCGSPDHQGICAEVAEFEYADPASFLRDEDALVVCLDQVQDPRNLGAVCRVAECAGASGVVIGERRSARVTPVVCSASAGAVEHIPVARVRNTADYLAAAKEEGAWVYGATVAPEAVPYHEPDYRGRVVLVLGAEGRGLRPRVASACDRLVELPLRGRIESLNVAAAASAVMYGILHFRREALDKVP